MRRLCRDSSCGSEWVLFDGLQVQRNTYVEETDDAHDDAHDTADAADNTDAADALTPLTR